MDIYLDNAATSHPKPESVLTAVREAMTTFNANPGRSGHTRALESGRLLIEAREAIADLFGVDDPFSIIFCFNCTDALNLAIKGSLKRGDHVISSMIEHNSVLRVLMELKSTNQIELTLVKPDSEGMIRPSNIRSQIRSKTSLIVLTHASNVTGIIQPVAEVGKICKQNGIRYLIDGAQAAGCTPFRLSDLNCDLYAFPGHKALLGPQGTGGLYIAPGVRLRTLREGGTGTSSESMRQPDEMPERFESGTLNMHGIAGLGAGARHVKRHLRESLYTERALTIQLLNGLSQRSDVVVYGSRDPIRRVGVVSFNIADLPSGIVVDSLDRMGIAVRGGLHCAPGTHEMLGTTSRGAVRVSVGPSNTPEEIDSFLSALSQFR